MASILELKSLFTNNDKRYKSKLAYTATNLYNREHLFHFIYPSYKQSKDNSSKTKITDTKTSQINSAKTVDLPKPIQDSKGKEIKSKEGLMKEVKSRLEVIEKDRKTTKPILNKVTKTNKAEAPKVVNEKKTATKTIKAIPTNKKSTDTLRKTISKEAPKAKVTTIDRGSSIDIVEKFINTRPAINRPEDKEYNEEIKLAESSLNEDFDLVSETMAKLFIQQGHKEKAIKIYEKLILIYPEKNTYFAARISELNN